MISLLRADVNDCVEIYYLQIKAFKELLDKYNDKETNPGAETLERIRLKMNQDFTDYYFIQASNKNIGAIRIAALPDNVYRISPIFILPEFQGRGYAQQAIKEVEKSYPQANVWRLDTIKEEHRLCYLYEKMGYKRTGKEEKLQENMTIIYYEKIYNFTGR